MLRIDPAAQPLWRTPDSVQFGHDPIVAVLEPVPPGADPVLGALVRGVDPASLDATAREAGLPPYELQRMLEVVAPLLMPAPAPLPPDLDVALDAPADLAALLTAMLGVRAAGPMAAGGDRPDLVLLAAHHLVPPAATVQHLRDDLPHLAIVFGDQAVVVGPLVDPGTTPCLRCAEEHRLDSPARRAVGAQLLRRSRSRTSAVLPLRLRAAALVADAIIARRAGRPTGLEGAELRLAPDGSLSRRERPWHERCSCRWGAPPA